MNSGRVVVHGTHVVLDGNIVERLNADVAEPGDEPGVAMGITYSHPCDSRECRGPWKGCQFCHHGMAQSYTELSHADAMAIYPWARDPGAWRKDDEGLAAIELARAVCTYVSRCEGAATLRSGAVAA